MKMQLQQRKTNEPKKETDAQKEFLVTVLFRAC